MSDSATETPNVLVNEPSLSADGLPPDFQTLRQKIMNHLQTEHSQRSYLARLRYEITDEILAQTNLALETIPTANITETNALTYAIGKCEKKRVSTPNNSHYAWQQWLERKIKQ